MASSAPLEGVILVDCAKANVKYGLEAAAKQCGYGQDLAGFQAALTSACQAMGVSVDGFDDFDVLAENQEQMKPPGIEVSPDSPSDL